MIGDGDKDPVDTNVNDTKTKRNKTMLEQIRSDYMETSYGRAMAA